MSSRPVHGALLAALALALPLGLGAGAARADRVEVPRDPADPLAILRAPGARWSFQLVHGDAPDKLRPSEAATSVTCEVEAWPAPGALERSRIACRVDPPPGATGATGVTAPAPEALPGGGLWLVLDGSGVRALPRPDADPADRSAVRGFTFPTGLSGSSWTLEATGRDGGRAHVTVRPESRRVRGAVRTVWVSEVVHHAPPSGPRPGEPDRELTVYAPGLGPVLICEIRARLRPSHLCLRLDETAQAPPAPPAPDGLVGRLQKPPARPDRGAGSDPLRQVFEEPSPPPRPSPQEPRGTVAIASKQALDPSTLTAAQVAAKIQSAYLPGVRRCYRAALAKQPALRGTLTVAFTVNAVGKVDAASVKGVDPDLARCVQALPSTWRFPIPQSTYAEPRTARFSIGLALAP